MKKLVFILSLFIVMNLSASDTKKMMNELKSASEIEADHLRLEAYDAILEKNNLKQKQSKKDKVKTKWEVSVDTNPLDDTKIYLFYLVADEGKSSWDQKVALLIRKSNNGDELFINWGAYLGSEAFVTLRIGKSEATKTQWSLSTDSKATFYSGSSIKLIQEILRTDTVVAQCVPYGENPITAVFDVRGLREIAYKYKDELEWFED